MPTVNSFLSMHSYNKGRLEERERTHEESKKRKNKNKDRSRKCPYKKVRRKSMYSSVLIINRLKLIQNDWKMAVYI